MIENNPEHTWYTLNQSFLIEELTSQTYREIYRNNSDPLKAFGNICKKIDSLNEPIKKYQLFKVLYNKLKLPEKQLLARHFGQWIVNR